MKPEEINDKLETIKAYLKESHETGIIKPSEYNDIWAKIKDIKVPVKCDNK